LLKSEQRDVDFKQNKIFVLFKQETNISKSLFVGIKLKRLICVTFAKTILTIKITNRYLRNSALYNL